MRTVFKSVQVSLWSCEKTSYLTGLSSWTETLAIMMWTTRMGSATCGRSHQQRQSSPPGKLPTVTSPRSSALPQLKNDLPVSSLTDTKSNGRRRSEMWICGSERDRNQWPSRYCGGSGAGSDTPSGSQNPAPHAKP